MTTSTKAQQLLMVFDNVSELKGKIKSIVEVNRLDKYQACEELRDCLRSYYERLDESVFIELTTNHIHNSIAALYNSLINCIDNEVLIEIIDYYIRDNDEEYNDMLK